MGAYKYSMVFSVTTGADNDPSERRTGGWSESVYFSTNLPADVADFRRFALARAALLPRSAKVMGIRTQFVDPNDRAALTSVNFPGPQNPDNDTDAPQVAIGFTVGDVGGTHSRKMKVACIPDGFTIRGEFKPDQDYARLLANYFKELNGWEMRARDLTIPKHDITSIAANGDLITVRASAYARGDVLQIYSTETASGELITQQVKVSAATFNDVTKLANWDGGLVTGGKVQKVAFIYPVIRAVPNPAVKTATRKIGRPSNGFRGRRTKRRR